MNLSTKLGMDQFHGRVFSTRTVSRLLLSRRTQTNSFALTSTQKNHDVFGVNAAIFIKPAVVGVTVTESGQPAEQSKGVNFCG